jgi:RNA polymerase sigma factor (sigma-70 family)
VPAVGDAPLRALAFAARDGDTHALEGLVAGNQHDVYRLALRMLWHPDDAQDATQEALVRIVTRIGSYRGDAAFRTWAYRVAANHILNWRKSRVEQEHLTFRRFAEQLHDGLVDPSPDTPDAALLAEEVKLGCTLGMLLCLDRDQRLAYVLTDVFGLSSDEVAYVCGTTPTAVRKRASRARARLRAFVSEHCGLVNRATACRCDRRVATAVSLGRVDPAAPLFARSHDVAVAVGDMERLHDLASLMRSHPDYRAPEETARRMQDLIARGDYGILN